MPLSTHLSPFLKRFVSNGTNGWIRTPQTDSPRYQRMRSSCGALVRAEQVKAQAVTLELWHVEAILPNGPTLTAYSLGLFSRHSADVLNDLSLFPQELMLAEQVRQELIEVCQQAYTTARVLFWLPEEASAVDPAGQEVIAFDPLWNQSLIDRLASSVALHDPHGPYFTVEEDDPWFHPLLPCKLGLLLPLDPVPV